MEEENKAQEVDSAASINDIFSGAEAPVAPVIEEKVVTQAEIPDVKDEQLPPSGTETTQPHMVPLKALTAEREKLNSKLSEYETKLRAQEQQNAALLAQMQISQMQQQQPQQQFEAPDPLTDPEGALRHQANLFEARLFETKISMGRAIANQQYGQDLVAAAEQEAAAAAARDRNLFARIGNSQNPVAEAVKWYQEQNTLKAVGNKTLDQLKEEWKQEILQSLQLQQQVSSQQSQPNQNLMPSDLGSATNVSRRVAQPWQGQTPIKDILGV